MSKKDYKKLAADIIQCVGGKENIAYCVHCVTRLRFTLKDLSKADSKAVEAVLGVFGTQQVGEQYQVIIGNDVPLVYNEVCEQAEIQKEKGLDDVLDADMPKEKMTVKKAVLSFFSSISGCIAPVLPVLIAASFVKLFLQLGVELNWVSDSSSTYQVLTFAYDSAFYFLPVFVGAFTARKYGGNMGMGMLMGAILIAPTFVAAVDAGESFTIFGLPVYMTSYTSSIFPAIATVYVMCKVEKFLRKLSPDILQTIIVPFGTLLIMLPVSLSIVAPLGAIIGSAYANGVKALYKLNAPIAVMIMGALITLLISTGMHIAMFPYMIEQISVHGAEGLMLNAAALGNFVSAAVCVGIMLKTKKKDVKAITASTALTSFWGTSEPAIFGVLLKYKEALAGAIAGGAVGGLIMGLCNVRAFQFTANEGVLIFPAYYESGTHNLLYFVIALAAAVIVGMVVAFVLYKDSDKEA